LLIPVNGKPLMSVDIDSTYANDIRVSYLSLCIVDYEGLGFSSMLSWNESLPILFDELARNGAKIEVGVETIV
jgi:hypothetical protein